VTRVAVGVSAAVAIAVAGGSGGGGGCGGSCCALYFSLVQGSVHGELHGDASVTDQGSVGIGGACIRLAEVFACIRENGCEYARVKLIAGRRGVAEVGCMVLRVRCSHAVHAVLPSEWRRERGCCE
jgi:hypothetical protein